MFDVTQNSVFSHYTNSLGPVLQMIYWEVKFLSIAYLQLIKFYWNKVMLIHFVYGCYCATVGETSGPQNQQYFLSCPFAEKVWAAFALGDLILSLKRQCTFRFIRLSSLQWGPFCPQHINTTHTSSVPLPSFNFSSLSLYVLVEALQKNRKKKKKECVQILLRGRFILRDCLV